MPAYQILDYRTECHLIKAGHHVVLTDWTEQFICARSAYALEEAVAAARADGVEISGRASYFLTDHDPDVRYACRARTVTCGRA